MVIRGSGTITSSPWLEYSNAIATINIFASQIHITTANFSGCSFVTHVTLPYDTQEIGAYAFRDCTCLASISLPYSLIRIGRAAFKGCTSLSSVILPDSLTNISAETFKDCISLSSVSIPKSVTNIYSQAFKGCALTSVTVSRNCKVHESAFDEGVTINYYD